MQTTERLKSITNLTAKVISSIIAIAIPLGYFLTAYSYESRLILKQANTSADAISKLIYVHVATWQFQDHRLEDILVNSGWYQQDVLYRIFDSQNKLIVSVGNEPSPPAKTINASLTDGESLVGSVETKISLRPLLLQTIFTAFFAIITAWLVNFVLRTLPFAALERVTQSLQDSQHELLTEVRAKEKALQEHRQMSDVMRYQATHDALTTLPNRAYFNERIQEALRNATITSGQIAILIMDLNRFKEINDALGHDFGDKVLVAISTRIRKILPQSSLLARLGGDEYAILIEDANEKNVEEQAQLISTSLQTHIIIDGYHLSIQGSIGAALFPNHGDNSESIMRHADIAMYYAKQNAKSFSFYDSSYDDNSPSRLTLTADLQQAIDTQGLSLLYQPKLDIKSGKVLGVEALARWHHPIHGHISPEVFISLAEQAGNINTLTSWVMETAMMQLADWHALGMNLSMAINISARNLQNEDLLQQLINIIRKYNIPPNHVNLEITESSMMIDPAKSRDLIHKFSQWGIKISVDDFGTGYSSLAYLKKLTVHELKIDRSFIKNMLNDPDDQVIVKSTIDLAHNLKLKIVAEGVEDKITYDLLQNYGCDIAQGFYICKPVNAMQLEAFYKNTQLHEQLKMSSS